MMSVDSLIERPEESVAEKPHLYDKYNIENLVWPDTLEASRIKNYIVPLMKKGINHYIDNIEADLYVLRYGDLFLPIVATEGNYTNSWVCSPYGHYIVNGKASIQLISNAFLSRIVKGALNCIGALSRKGQVDSVVYVNNWLFSTDLYSKNISLYEVQQLTNFLKTHFPRHAIVFRSLNALTNGALKKTLANCGYHFVASRQVYITDAKNEEIFKTRIIKSDLKLWNETSFEIIDEKNLPVHEAAEYLRLYHSLYVNERTSSNPLINKEFIDLLISQDFLSFKVLKKGTEIKGIAGFFIRDGILFCPFMGYEKKDADQTVIYRLLNTMLLLEAQQAGVLFNQSAGASFYKTIRRAKSCLESIAVYTEHLPYKQKFTWKALKTFINAIAPPYMKKY
jgi:hypothetical protein